MNKTLRNLTLYLAAVLAAGCANIHQRAETTTAGTNSVRVTEMRVRTLGDAKQVVERLNASNGTTQRIGADGVEQQSTADVIRDILGAAFAAGRASVVPVPAPAGPAK